MRAFTRVAERLGNVNPEDEHQVERFFAEEAPALPEGEQAKILEALLELEGEDLEPLQAREYASGPSEVLLSDSPPLATPETEVVSERAIQQIGEIAGAMALTFSSVFYTAGLDVKVSLNVADRSVKFLLAGPDTGRLEREDKPLLVTMERLADVLAERNEAIDRVTMSLSTEPAPRAPRRPQSPGRSLVRPRGGGIRGGPGGAA
jgi:hypothetical protein